MPAQTKRPYMTSMKSAKMRQVKPSLKDSSTRGWGGGGGQLRRPSLCCCQRGQCRASLSVGAAWCVQCMWPQSQRPPPFSVCLPCTPFRIFYSHFIFCWPPSESSSPQATNTTLPPAPLFFFSSLWQGSGWRCPSRIDTEWASCQRKPRIAQ